TLEGAKFARELKGASHPSGSVVAIEGMTELSRSPFLDRSSMAACDANSNWAMSPACDDINPTGAALAIERTRIMAAASAIAVRLSLASIFDITSASRACIGHDFDFAAVRLARALGRGPFRRAASPGDCAHRTFGSSRYCVEYPRSRRPPGSTSRGSRRD